MRRGLIVATLAFAMLGIGQEAYAGVRTTKDGRGDFRGTRMLTVDAEGSRILGAWAGPGRGDRRTVLNPQGDVVGDLWPTVAENRVSPYFPWVVWSRHTGVDYDLVWSRWTELGWSPVVLLEPEANALGDDLDADLDFDKDGRAFAIWWREENGSGRVYLSMFLQTRWMAPYPVSHPGLDGRYPTFEAVGTESILVRYEVQTADGPETVEQTVAFDRPVTITDDINPLVHLEAKEPMKPSERHR